MFQYHQSYQVQSSYYSASKPTNPCPIPSPLDSADRRTGRVKFYNVKKGYGFIIPSYHSSCRSLQQSDLSSTDEGKSVSFFCALYSSYSLFMYVLVFVHYTSIMNAHNGYPVGLNKVMNIHAFDFFTLFCLCVIDLIRETR